MAATAAAFAAMMLLPAAALGQSTAPSAVRVKGLAPRLFPAIAWTGDRLFVFGGSVPGDSRHLRTDGGLVDVKTGRVTRVPAPRVDPLLSAAAVTVGSKVVLFGFGCRGVVPDEDGAAPGCKSGAYAAAELDLRAHRWHLIALPAELTERRSVASADAWMASTPGVAAADRAVFVSGKWDGRQSFWTYDPVSRQWASVADPPQAAENACVAGSNIVGLDLQARADGVPGALQPSLTVLDLASASGWRTTVRDVAAELGEDQYVSCTADDAVAIGFVPSGQMRPDNLISLRRADVANGSWRPVATPPIDVLRDSRRGPGLLDSGLWTGSDLVYPGAGVAYDPARDSWRHVDTRSLGLDTRQTVWTGDAVVGFSPGPGPTSSDTPTVFLYPISR